MRDSLPDIHSNFMLRVREEVLPEIKSGEKSVEIRPATPKFEKVRLRDFLTFNEAIVRMVIGIRRFETIEEVVRVVGAGKIFPPLADQPDELITELHKLFAQSDQSKDFLVFDLQPIPDEV